MRKFVAVLLGSIIVCTLTLSGCAVPAPAPEAAPVETDLKGDTNELLAALIETAGVDFGMSFDEAVTSENSEGYIGLDAVQLAEYVEDAYIYTGAISASANLVALVKTKEGQAADVEALMADGFDSYRWICVMPEQSFVMYAEDYVLLGATTTADADALKAAFAALAKNTASTPNVFFDRDKY